MTPVFLSRCQLIMTMGGPQSRCGRFGICCVYIDFNFILSEPAYKLFVHWYVGKVMEHGEHSEADKVITAKKKCYEGNVGSGEESDGAKGY